MGSISNLSSYLQSTVSAALQNVSGQTTGSSSTTSVGSQADSQQLSPFAQLMSMLQKLQQSDPAQYGQVTQQIATNLQSAAQTDQANGNTAAATQLSQLANDFTNASRSGQLPNIQDLAQAVGGHHHHHHHSHAAAEANDASASGTGPSSSSTSGSAAQVWKQFLSSTQSIGTQTDPLNPMSIILSTLSNAGITPSNV